MGSEFFGHGAELDTVVEVAGVNPGKQRN